MRCKYLNFEGEIAIVIGAPAFNISQHEADHYIAGYTIANDYGLHDFRDTDAGSRPVEPGDVVTVSVEGLGELTNTIVSGGVEVRLEIGARSKRFRGSSLHRNGW